MLTYLLGYNYAMRFIGCDSIQSPLLVSDRFETKATTWLESKQSARQIVSSKASLALKVDWEEGYVCLNKNEMVYCNKEVRYCTKIVLLAIIIYHNIAHKLMLKQTKYFSKL